MSVVSVRELVIEFDTPKGRKRVVNGVSFDVSPGEVLGILGESGSGKTMSTQAILGLIDGYPGVMGGEITLTPSQGEPVSLLGDLEGCLVTRRGVKHKKERAWQQRVRRVMSPLWGSQVTAIFQNPRRSLDPLMTVGQQLTESLRYAAGGQAQASEALRAEAIEWLERVQMVNPERVFESYPHELSGGMCQRAMIAVALACKPALLVADEPTTGLDATVRAQIITLLQELVREARCAMLYISHDIREVLYLTDRVIVMRHGDVVERVSTADLKADQGERHPYTRSLLDASGLVGQRANTSPEETPSMSVMSEVAESSAHAVTSTPALLEAKGLKKSFIGRDKSVTRAIDDVDLTLHQGEVVALIGESGSGKTTLGRALTRLLQLDEGSVTLNGQPLTSLKGRALREARRSFQVVFQNQQANLHPNMSVREMLDESLRLHRAQLSSEERATHITELLGRVGLHDHEGRYVASLSGGEQRRVGLARILATTPQLIVADEPTSGLDAAIKLQTIALLKELKGAELTYLLISHDLGLVRRIADRVLVMLRGRIIERFSIAELGQIEHHPYTQKLLAAAQLGDRPLEHDTASIEDLAPSEQGCAYASLCPLARARGLTERCRGERPPLSFTSPHRQEAEAHAVACFALTENAALTEEQGS